MFADYGRSPFKSLKKVVSRTRKMTAGTVKALAKGDIKTAGRNLMTLANPISAVASITTDNKRKLDWARLTMPTSVVAIENKKLRKQAALGYAAAAVVASAAFAATAGASAAGGAGAGTATAGGGTAAAGTGASALKSLKDAKSVADLAQLGKSLVGGKDKGEQERAGTEGGRQLTETEIKERGNGKVIKYAIVGVGVLGMLGIGYYLYSTSREA